MEEQNQEQTQNLEETLEQAEPVNPEPTDTVGEHQGIGI